jgi:hypothetical protein
VRALLRPAVLLCCVLSALAVAAPKKSKKKAPPPKPPAAEVELSKALDGAEGAVGGCVLEGTGAGTWTRVVRVKLTVNGAGQVMNATVTLAPEEPNGAKTRACVEAAVKAVAYPTGTGSLATADREWTFSAAACSECGREVSEVAPPPTPEVRSPPVAPPEPEAPATAALPEAAARCAEHPDAPAVRTCARCGRFCCGTCVPEPERQPNCPGCHRRMRQEANPKELHRVRRQLTVSFFTAVLIIIAVGIALPVVSSPHAPRVDWMTLGALVALLQSVTAVVFLARPRPGLAWFGVLVELLPSLGLVTEFGPNCITLSLLAIPVITAVRVVKWSALLREAASLTT